MRVPRKEPEKARIEVIPMIDIIFFLLVFFMISTLSMTINRGLPVNLPKAASSQRELRESFNITVDIIGFRFGCTVLGDRELAADDDNSHGDCASHMQSPSRDQKHHRVSAVRHL